MKYISCICFQFSKQKSRNEWQNKQETPVVTGLQKKAAKKKTKSLWHQLWYQIWGKWHQLCSQKRCLFHSKKLVLKSDGFRFVCITSSDTWGEGVLFGPLAPKSYSVSMTSETFSYQRNQQQSWDLRTWYTNLKKSSHSWWIQKRPGLKPWPP